ncbi:MAG TPA: Pls/PosA family non-ribosomal peptide synthetase, partial [Methylibium sp.]
QRSLSYAELDELASVVASNLIAAGVGPGSIVGLWLPRCLDLLVAQAGIAKAGAAWLPFDADTPVERIAVCLDDAKSACLLSCEAWLPRLDALPQPVLTAEALSLRPSGALQRRAAVQANDPAYVIYTSGSTGRPKGIVISQGSICHFLRSENERLGVRQSDRVYQGFSVAFDMSFEEIWISYLVGASLWIAPREIASDPEALPAALIEQQITVLHAVPTLLALFAQDVPSLRLINLGGEMCPQALVARWARPGRQVFNSYGPTEATVSASMAELHAGEPVTIGEPLPNYVLLVVAPEVVDGQGLKLLPRGEVGELCISGPGVAAGYLGRPELTAEKFLANPWANGDHDARLYRTGDLARIDAHGRVECLGRTDDQVKLRGFRVELGEIEAQLARQPGVGTVAVVLHNSDGLEQLVAFLVPRDGAAIDAAALRTALAAVLPPYMVPSRYEGLSEMPRLPSGKIDRKDLKARRLSIAPAAGESDRPEGAAEELLFAALQQLFPGLPLRRDADFFSDLGGHSLFAARLASAIRADAHYAQFSVRDIYQQRRLGAIAQAMGEAELRRGQAAAKPRAFTTTPALRRWLCGAAQALAVPPLVALRMAQWLAPFFTYHFFTGGPNDSIAFAVAISLAAFLLATMLAFVVTIAGKWLVLGRARPGRYPLWGLTYFRWWLSDRLIEAAPTHMLPGSSLFPMYLRALGARVGRDAQIGSLTLRAPDLLSIGDGASLGTAVNLENARVEGGELILGRIEIAANAYVGSFSVLEGNTTLGEYAHLDGISALADGQQIPARRIWSGSPARETGVFDPASRPPRPAVEAWRPALEWFYFSAGSLLIAALFFMPVFPAFMLIDWLDDADRFPWLQGNVVWIQLLKYFVLSLPASAVLILLTALISAALRWTFLPRLGEGSWPVRSRTYYEKWLVNQIQETSLQVLHGVYATVYAPFWYRLLGAKVGRHAEISTALGVVPDMLTLGDETFIADNVLLGDEEIDGGWMTMQPTVVSRRSFVGNGAYVPDGSVLPENLLIGVHTRVPENAQMREGDTWLGSPPINLPAREQVAGYPDALTFRPSPLRRLGRGLVEALRIVAPHAIVIATGYTIVLDLMPAAGEEDWGQVVIGLTLAGLLYGLGSLAFVALLKWLLIGRYSRHAVPMWTRFVWFSEAVTNLYEGIAVPNFVRYLRGTPWLPWALRLLGTRIGRGVYLDTTDITEFDCVRVGDYSELNALSCPQTHLFEDRVMKIDVVDIGARVTMGARSTVLYGASVGDDAWLGPLTLAMKGEQLPAGSSWRGCPAAPAA